MTHGATMGGHVVSHAASRAGIEPGEVEDVLMGCALGLLLALARLAETRHQPWRAVCQYLLRWPSTAYVSFFRGTPLFG